MPITKATASSVAPAAKGDLVVGSATNDAAILAVGTNGHTLVADSAEATGLKWAAPASGSTFVGAKAYGTTNQSISHFTTTLVTWDSEFFDTDSMHSTSSNTSRLTIPAGKTGYWQITASLGYDANANGVRQVNFSKNGSYVNAEQVQATATYGNIVGYSNIMYLTAGDYIEVSAFQSTGGSLNLIKSSTESYFAANFIGA